MNICPLILHIQHLSLKYTRVALYFGKATKDPHTLVLYSTNQYARVTRRIGSNRELFHEVNWSQSMIKRVNNGRG